MKNNFKSVKENVEKVIVDINTSDLTERIKVGTMEIGRSIKKIITDDRSEKEKEEARIEKLKQKQEKEKEVLFKSLLNLPGVDIIESIGINDENLKQEFTIEAVLALFKNLYHISDPTTEEEVTYYKVEKRVTGDLLAYLFILPEDSEEFRTKVDELCVKIEAATKLELEEEREKRREKIKKMEMAKRSVQEEDLEVYEEVENPEDEAEFGTEIVVKIDRIVLAVK